MLEGGYGWCPGQHAEAELARLRARLHRSPFPPLNGFLWPILHQGTGMVLLMITGVLPAPFLITDVLPVPVVLQLPPGPPGPHVGRQRHVWCGLRGRGQGAPLLPSGRASRCELNSHSHSSLGLRSSKQSFLCIKPTVVSFFFLSGFVLAYIVRREISTPHLLPLPFPPQPPFYPGARTCCSPRRHRPGAGAGSCLDSCSTTRGGGPPSSTAPSTSTPSMGSRGQ